MRKDCYLRTRTTEHTRDSLDRLLREVNAPRLYKNVKDGNRQIISMGTILNDFVEASLKDGSLQAFAHGKYLSSIQNAKSA